MEKRWNNLHPSERGLTPTVFLGFLFFLCFYFLFWNSYTKTDSICDYQPGAPESEPATIGSSACDIYLRAAQSATHNTQRRLAQ